MCNDCEQTELLKQIAASLVKIEVLLKERLPVPPKVVGIEVQPGKPEPRPLVPPPA